MTVRSKPRPDLDRLLKESVEAVKAMTPRQRRDMIRAQRRSWARGEVGIGADADEAAYAKALREKDWDTISRLEAESAARVEKFDEDHGGED
jgi:hypothetical protein